MQGKRTKRITGKMSGQMHPKHIWSVLCLDKHLNMLFLKTDNCKLTTLLVCYP
jgi:hypothetical protein